MKKRLLPVALLLGTMAANAQVGIGTATPNKSAELLIESKNRGLLIPNVPLNSTTDAVTITNGNVQSLMVYATKTQGDITPGYYYWDINVWKRLTADADIPQIVVNKFQEIVNKDGDKVQNIIKNIVKNTEGNVIYEGDKLYTYTKEGDKVIKQEIKDKLTTIVYDEASGDYIYYNENAVDRNGKIIGEGIRIKVKETVINKFGDIINNKTVQEHITNYLDGTHVGGNVYYEGDKLTYVTKEGDRKEVSINSVVTANESKTAIITVNKKQYYVAEEYLVANKGVVPTTVDAANLPKGIYAVDVVGGVVNNLEEIVNNGPVNVDGRTFKTVNDYITYLTESKGGFTKIVYDQSTGDVVFQEWNETTQKYENVDNSKFSTIVKGNETVTTLLDNKNGTYTYTSENGTKTIVDIPSSVVKQFETIVKQPVTVDGRTFTNVDEYIKYVTETKGGFTKIVYNKEGDVVFQEWNETTQKYENVDNSKFSTIVKGNETVTALVKNADGTYTYYNEKQIGADGQPLTGETGVTIDPKEVSVALNTTKNVYEFKNSAGVVVGEIDANAKGIAFNKDNTSFTSTNVQDALVELLNKITTVEGTSGDLVVSGGLEFLAKTTGVKALLADANIQVANKGISTDKLGDKAVTSEKLNAGETTEEGARVGIADKDGNVVYQTLDTVVKGNETVTVLVKNADGTYTYYNEKQIDANGDPIKGATGVTIDPKLVNVEDLSKTEGKYIFKDSKGNPIATININSDNILYDSTNSGLTSTNVKDALDELANTIATSKGDLSVSGGLEFTGTTDGAAKLLADAGIQIANKGISTDKLGDKAVTSEKLNAGETTEEGARVGIADKDGNVVYQTLDTVVKGNETITTLVQGTNIKVSELKEGNSIKYTLDVPTATKDVAGVVKAGEGLNVDGAGNLTVNYETAKEKLATGNVTSTTIVVNKGEASEGSTFKNIDLEVAPGTNGQVMVTKEGKATWVAQSEIVPTTTNAIKTDGTELITTVNDKEAKLTLAGDVTLKGGKTVVNAIQGTPVSNVPPNTNGQALVYNTTNKQWEPGTPNVGVANVTDAKTLSTDGVIVIGADSNATATTAVQSLLADVKLNIAKDKITTEHIANGTIKPEDIAKAGNNQVLVTDTDGNPSWKNQSKVAPQFFYMPAVIFDTNAKGNGLVRDLYKEYVDQFTGGKVGAGNANYDIAHGANGYKMPYAGGIVGSEGAPADIAVFESGELHYYVTYYDTKVFANLKIGRDGKLTYDIIGNATPASYMNIVFVIK
ncbi:hypothetical protein [Myroides sp. N17-2]|uniref:hypothetical protein n=1 Tax=Myroides sp. N17-2 TaxID=2030799 RepID=UPI000EFB7AA3|nr:hypothetical protein [Myroides sp. N17-2]